VKVGFDQKEVSRGSMDVREYYFVWVEGIAELRIENWNV